MLLAGCVHRVGDPSAAPRACSEERCCLLRCQAPYKKWRPLEPEGDPAAAAAYATAEAVAKHAKGGPAGEVGTPASYQICIQTLHSYGTGCSKRPACELAVCEAESLSCTGDM